MAGRDRIKENSVDRWGPIKPTPPEVRRKAGITVVRMGLKLGWSKEDIRQTLKMLKLL